MIMDPDQLVDDISVPPDNEESIDVVPDSHRQRGGNTTNKDQNDTPDS